MKSVSSRSMMRCLRTTCSARSRPASVRIASLCSPRSTSPSASSRFSISPAEARETPSISATRDASVGRPGRLPACTRRSGRRGSRSSRGTRRRRVPPSGVDRRHFLAVRLPLQDEHHPDPHPRRDRRRHDLRRPADRALPEPRTPALRAVAHARSRPGSSSSCFWDVVSHGRRAGRVAPRDATRGPRSPATPRCCVVGFALGLMSLVYYDEWMKRRAGDAPFVGPGAAAVDEFEHRTLDRDAHAGPAARAADRDRHRPAQLRRGSRDRAVGGGGRDRRSRSC